MGHDQQTYATPFQVCGQAQRINPAQLQNCRAFESGGETPDYLYRLQPKPQHGKHHSKTHGYPIQAYEKTFINAQECKT